MAILIGAHPSTAYLVRNNGHIMTLTDVHQILQMLSVVDTATWVARIVDKQCGSLVIDQAFQLHQIGAPLFLRQEIIVTHLNVEPLDKCTVQTKAWPRQQHILAPIGQGQDAVF